MLDDGPNLGLDRCKLSAQIEQRNVTGRFRIVVQKTILPFGLRIQAAYTHYVSCSVFSAPRCTCLAPCSEQPPGSRNCPGFFTETTAGVYQSRGARLAVMAGPGVVRFGGLTLKHKGGAFREPVGVDATGGVVNTYTATRTETNRLAYRAIEYAEIYPGITLRLSLKDEPLKPITLLRPGPILA